MKAMSELVLFAKLSGGTVFESTRRLDTASAASICPARRPTRGSVPAADDAFAGAGTLPADEDVAGAHATTESRPAQAHSDTSRVTGRAPERVWYLIAIDDSSDVTKMERASGVAVARLGYRDSKSSAASIFCMRSIS